MTAAGTFKRLHKELQTQDNAITANPIFIVERADRQFGYDPSYTENIAWVDGEFPDIEVTEENDRVLFRRLESGEAFLPGAEEHGREEFWVRTAYKDRWEHVQPFLTRRGAEEYIRDNAHNLGRARIYVASGHRNHEWIFLRKLFLSPPLILWLAVILLCLFEAITRRVWKILKSTKN